MKTSTRYIILAVLCALSGGCYAQQPDYDTQMSVIIDVTEKMRSVPTANDLVSPLHLNANPWQGIRVTVSTIADRDITDETTISLESESKWTGSILIRKAKVQRFLAQLKTSLGTIKQDARSHSIVYKGVASQANALSSSTAINKCLLIYSDLRENSTLLNFYDTRTAEKLRKQPEWIIAKMQAALPLKSLTNVQAWLLYDPKSYDDNNTYSPLAGFYSKLLAAHGATVHVTTKFQP